MTDALNMNFIHREFGNDVRNLPDASREVSELTGVEQTWIDQGKRVAVAALPFLTLYKPLAVPVSLVFGGLRTVGSASQLLESYQQGDISKLAPALAQTMVSTAAVAATLFGSPMGMLITTGQDLLIELGKVIELAEKGQYEQMTESFLIIANNSLYLTMMLSGGLEIAIAALTMQVLTGIYHSHADLEKGNYIEATAHIMMTLVRCNQLAGCIVVYNIGCAKPAQKPLNDAQLLEHAKKVEDRELVAVLEKYHNKGRFVPAIYNAIDACDWKAMELLINNNGLVEHPNLYGSNKIHPPILMLAMSKAHLTNPRQPTVHNIEALINGGANVNFDYRSRLYKKFTGHNQPFALFLIGNNRLDLLALNLRYGMDPRGFFYDEESRKFYTISSYYLRSPSVITSTQRAAIQLLNGYNG
ncbi:MAG: hypothetical protein HYX48_04405 [Chlamydiales bacterium]|nr:hypothetical protein [Chlamydiales bacterium]